MGVETEVELDEEVEVSDPMQLRMNSNELPSSSPAGARN